METFFVFLDILGFKKVVENNSAEDLKNIVDSFFAGFESAVDKSRTINEEKIKLEDLNFRLLSDSILIWIDAEKCCHRSFRNLLEAVSCLLAYGLKYGFPLRGVMTYEELFCYKKNENTFFSNESIYGKALVNAYSKEGAMEWAGCVLTIEAWEKACSIWDSVHTLDDDPNCYFYQYPLLVWYPIPCKTSTDNGIAINWNCEVFWNSERTIDSTSVSNSFSAFNKQVTGANPKMDNTIEFLKYTEELCRKYFSRTSNHQTRKDEISHPDY